MYAIKLTSCFVYRGMPAVLLPNHAMRSQVEEWKEAAGYDPGMAVDR